MSRLRRRGERLEHGGTVMGAWGYGLLQNDDAQDGLLDLADGIRADVARLQRKRPAEAVAGRLSAAVGLLLQMRIWHVFDPERDFHPTLIAVLERHEPAFSALPKTAVNILGQLRQGKGPELVALDGELPDELMQAFFDSKPGFGMERPTGMRHAGMFEHPASAAYVQEVAEQCVKLTARGFRSRDTVTDLGREGGQYVSALTVLLQIEPCQVEAERFRDWWERFRTATAGFESEEDDTERQYYTRYRRCLRLALDHGLHRFSAEKPKPLEE